LTCVWHRPPDFVDIVWATSMTPNQWDAWMALPAERRQEAVTIRDAKHVGFVQTHMKSLWQLDLDTGCNTFSSVQYPLLSAMQFVDTSAEIAKFPTHEISWPEMFHADPAWIRLLVDQTLGRNKHPRKLLPPGRWRFQLLRPQPQNWPDLERCLARLVEQLVLHASSEPSGSSRVAAQTSESAALGSAAVPLTARAAKRLRQRERRKLCKRGILPTPGTISELSQTCDVSEEEKRRPLDEDVSSEASASTAVGSRHTRFWADFLQREGEDEEEGSTEDDLRTVDGLSSFTPSSDLLPPLSPEGCQTPRDLWPATPDSSPRLGCRNDTCLPLPPLLLPPCVENCWPAPGIWKSSTA